MAEQCITTKPRGVDGRACRTHLFPPSSALDVDIARLSTSWSTPRESISAKAPPTSSACALLYPPTTRFPRHIIVHRLDPMQLPRLTPHGLFHPRLRGIGGLTRSPYDTIDVDCRCTLYVRLLTHLVYFCLLIRRVNKTPVQIDSMYGSLIVHIMHP